MGIGFRYLILGYTCCRKAFSNIAPNLHRIPDGLMSYLRLLGFDSQSNVQIQYLMADSNPRFKPDMGNSIRYHVPFIL
jgi:hypothetical protein